MTNTEGRSKTVSKTADYSDAADPACGRVTYEANNAMQDYDHMDPESIEKIKNDNTIIVAPKSMEQVIKKIKFKGDNDE